MAFRSRARRRPSCSTEPASCFERSPRASSPWSLPPTSSSRTRCRCTALFAPRRSRSGGICGRSWRGTSSRTASAPAAPAQRRAPSSAHAAGRTRRLPCKGTGYPILTGTAKRIRPVTVKIVVVYPSEDGYDEAGASERVGRSVFVAAVRRSRRQEHLDPGQRHRPRARRVAPDVRLRPRVACGPPGATRAPHGRERDALQLGMGGARGQALFEAPRQPHQVALAEAAGATVLAGLERWSASSPPASYSRRSCRSRSVERPKASARRPR